ncbi:transcription factor SPT20 homolog isoform X2 [Ptychodera flava]
MIITTMILSIISATVAAGAYIISIMAAVNEKTCPWDLSYCHTSYDAKVAVDSIVAVIVFAELVIATLQSVFYFSAYCCNQKPSSSTMYIAARSSEETSHDFPNAVIQNEPTQDMTPSGVEFVQHYPNQQPVPQGYVDNLKKQPVVTSNQQPSIQLQPQPGVVYQQGQGQQLPQQQHQLQQSQLIIKLQPQQHQVLQYEAIHQQQQGQQLPQQQVFQPQPQQLQHQVQQQLPQQQVPQPQPQQLPHQMLQAVQPVAIDQQPLGLQVPQLHTQQPYDQPQQFVQAGAMAQQQEGWLEPQPHPKVSLGPPGQPVEKVTNSDVNVDQDQVQSPTSSSVREDISAGLIENEVTLAWLKTKV